MYCVGSTMAYKNRDASVQKGAEEGLWVIVNCFQADQTNNA